MRHFIQAGNKIYSVDDTGSLTTPDVSETPSRSEFYQHGIEDFTGIFTPSNKVYLTMDRVGELDGGNTFSKKITPEEFSRQIKRIRNARE